MNMRKLSRTRHEFTRALLQITTASMLLVGASIAVHAQTPSTDRDNPTPFTSNAVAGDGADEKTEYFYSFTAGPGEITLTLDVKADKDTAVSSVDLALFDAKSKKLLSTYANPDHGSSKRAVETVKVRGTQTLVLSVMVSQGVDTYKIKLDGAVKIVPATGATDAPATGSAPPPANLSAQTGDASASVGTTATGAPDAAAATGTSADTTGAASDGAASGASAPSQSAAQTGASASGSGSKTEKVNAKVNSATARLSAIITSAGATAGSVKSMKKKKQ
ncbi:MAG: hypothetical protein ACJ741_02550 [Pyrinomonadaceae bacterium]